MTKQGRCAPYVLLALAGALGAACDTGKGGPATATTAAPVVFTATNSAVIDTGPPRTPSSTATVPASGSTEGPTPDMQTGELRWLEPRLEGNVCAKGRKLDWSRGALKSWRDSPNATTNNGVDGRYQIVARTSTRYQGTRPSVALCPIPGQPDRCWPQDAEKVDSQGKFKMTVHLRLSNWGKHVMKIRLGEDFECKVTLQEG